MMNRIGDQRRYSEPVSPRIRLRWNGQLIPEKRRDTETNHNSAPPNSSNSQSRNVAVDVNMTNIPDSPRTNHMFNSTDALMADHVQADDNEITFEIPVHHEEGDQNQEHGRPHDISQHQRHQHPLSGEENSGFESEDVLMANNRVNDANQAEVVPADAVADVDVVVVVDADADEVEVVDVPNRDGVNQENDGNSTSDNDSQPHPPAHSPIIAPNHNQNLNLVGNQANQQLAQSPEQEHSLSENQPLSGNHVISGENLGNPDVNNFRFPNQLNGLLQSTAFSDFKDQNVLNEAFSRCVSTDRIQNTTDLDRLFREKALTLFQHNDPAVLTKIETITKNKLSTFNANGFLQQMFLIPDQVTNLPSGMKLNSETCSMIDFKLKDDRILQVMVLKRGSLDSADIISMNQNVRKSDIKSWKKLLMEITQPDSNSNLFLTLKSLRVPNQVIALCTKFIYDTVMFVSRAEGYYFQIKLAMGFTFAILPIIISIHPLVFVKMLSLFAGTSCHPINSMTDLTMAFLTVNRIILTLIAGDLDHYDSTFITSGLASPLSDDVMTRLSILNDMAYLTMFGNWESSLTKHDFHFYGNGPIDPVTVEQQKRGAILHYLSSFKITDTNHLMGIMELSYHLFYTIFAANSIEPNGPNGDITRTLDRRQRRGLQAMNLFSWSLPKNNDLNKPLMCPDGLLSLLSLAKETTSQLEEFKMIVAEYNTDTVEKLELASCGSNDGIRIQLIISNVSIENMFNLCHNNMITALQSQIKCGLYQLRDTFFELFQSGGAPLMLYRKIMPVLCGEERASNEEFQDMIKNLLKCSRHDLPKCDWTKAMMLSKLIGNIRTGRGTIKTIRRLKLNLNYDPLIMKKPKERARKSVNRRFKPIQPVIPPHQDTANRPSCTTVSIPMNDNKFKIVKFSTLPQSKIFGRDRELEVFPANVQHVVSHDSVKDIVVKLGIEALRDPDQKSRVLTVKAWDNDQVPNALIRGDPDFQTGFPDDVEAKMVHWGKDTDTMFSTGNQIACYWSGPGEATAVRGAVLKLSQNLLYDERNGSPAIYWPFMVLDESAAYYGTTTLLVRINNTSMARDLMQENNRLEAEAKRGGVLNGRMKYIELPPMSNDLNH